ncbi:MAG: phage distal tail protein [Oscillospiraceae bacterium]
MRIYYINPDGKRFDFEDGIKVTQVSGINPSCAVTMEENAFGDGADYIGERINSRNILLTLYPCCDYDEARTILGKIFYGNGEGKLGFIYDNGEERRITCRFESMTAVLTARPGTIQVSLLCSDPYFYKDGPLTLICGVVDLWEFDDWELPEEDSFEFGNISSGRSTVVSNDGEVDSGCIIRIGINFHIDGVKIIKAYTDDYIALRGPFDPGDIITIDTRPRRKAIKLGNIHSTAETDIMPRLIWGSTFFSIPRGGGRIIVERESGDRSFDVTMQIDERYRGV